MKVSLRALGVLFAALLVSGAAFAQDRALSSERDKVGYMIGVDAAHSLGPGVADMDLAAFQRSLENSLAGGQPLLDPETSRKTGSALMASVDARKSGKPGPAIDRANVGLLMGASIGRSLAEIRGEFDVPTFMRGFRDASDPAGKPLLDEAEVTALRSTFATRLGAAREAERQARATAAVAREDEFLAKNKATKGVFATPSGLQYQVLRQGDGPRPLPGARVKVQYKGSLLDGKVFDSSYERGQPAVFGLDQVIAGWTEGLGLMPVGAKYRFWIPARLGYGQRGSGREIPPDSTLVFDVELLGIE